jgi:signal transduction histidine kinase
MDGRDNARVGIAEVLRQASVALGGKPVQVWEVAGTDRMVLQAASTPEPAHGAAAGELSAVLQRWHVPVRHGTRWVTCPLDGTGSWVVAPLRSRPAKPPPNGHERRSRERMILELVGLCLGLADGRAMVPRAPGGDPLRELAGLPAMIAHEASNPLTAARAGLQLAMATVTGWHDFAAERRLELLEDLGRVVDDIDRAVSFLRAVQDRARGALARTERFDAVRVVRSCVTLESRVLRDRGVRLELEAGVSSVYLKGDPNALFDLLVNLIRNAADAYPSRAGTVVVSVHLEDDMLRLAVRDQGIGIASDALDRVFEPGFTTKEFGKGSGMGLAQVRSVTEEMFVGRVTVSSQVGVGSTFTVHLPVPVQRASPGGGVTPL